MDTWHSVLFWLLMILNKWEMERLIPCSVASCRIECTYRYTTRSRPLIHPSKRIQNIPTRPKQQLLHSIEQTKNKDTHNNNKDIINMYTRTIYKLRARLSICQWWWHCSFEQVKEEVNGGVRLYIESSFVYCFIGFLHITLLSTE